MKYDIPGQHRWEDPPQRIGEPDLGILPSGILCLIDTHIGSPNRRYVNPNGRLPFKVCHSADPEAGKLPTYDLGGFWPACESLLVNSSNRFLFAAGKT